jgi:hypothetical protein
MELDPKFSPTQSYGGECPGVYYLRLQGGGWLLRDRLTAGDSSQLRSFGSGVSARKRLSRGRTPARAPGESPADPAPEMGMGRRRWRDSGLSRERLSAPGDVGR